MLRRVFRETSELFWGAPWLWVPVLLAEVCKYSMVVEAGPLRHAVMNYLISRSALSGPEEHLPRLALVAAILIRGISWSLGVVLYVYAMGLLARAVPLVQSGVPARRALTWNVPSHVWVTAGKAILTVLLSFGLTSLLIEETGGYGNLKVVYGFEGLCFLVVLLCLLRPFRRFVDANGPSQQPLSKSRFTDFGMLLMGFVLSSGSIFTVRYVVQRDADLTQLTANWYGYVFWLGVNLVTALPLAFMMIGLAAREPQVSVSDGEWRERDETSAI